MKATVFTGADRLETAASVLKGRRLGLITNPTGLDREFRSTIDLLNRDYTLVCLFAPEHGVRGDQQAGEKIESYTDSQTGLPVYSLYGENPHLKPEILEQLDGIVFDIQDVGARFYTYLYTLAYAMEDGAKAGKAVIVLDRVNPVTGTRVEGTVLDPAFASFVGRFPMATRYGLTIGEYARWLNETRSIGCDLTVIPLEGWKRSSYFDETDLCWIPPSPNLPTVDSCLCYIGNCLFEGTNLSEGRGTTKPFEVIGAPWLDAAGMIAQLRDQYPGGELPGVRLRETWYTPTFSLFAGELCRGIQFHILDRTAYASFETAVRLLDLIRRNHPEFEFLPPAKEGRPPFIDCLLGSDAIRAEGFSPDSFLAEQAVKLRAYESEIAPYRMYE